MVTYYLGSKLVQSFCCYFLKNVLKFFWDLQKIMISCLGKLPNIFFSNQKASDFVLNLNDDLHESFLRCITLANVLGIWLTLMKYKNLNNFKKSCWWNPLKSVLRGLSQIMFAFFGISWPRTPLVCTFYVANYMFFWPPTHPKCKRNLWKAPNFSQKTNEQISFSILTTRKYLKLEIEIQVLIISKMSG